MSSISVRRVCCCFCFTGISLCGVYVTLFFVWYSNLAFLCVCPRFALREEKSCKKEGSVPLCPLRVGSGGSSFLEV